MFRSRLYHSSISSHHGNRLMSAGDSFTKMSLMLKLKGKRVGSSATGAFRSTPLLRMPPADPDEIQREAEFRNQILNNPKAWAKSQFNLKPAAAAPQNASSSSSSSSSSGNNTNSSSSSGWYDNSTNNKGGTGGNPFVPPTFRVQFSPIRLFASIVLAYAAVQLFFTQQGGDVTNVMIPFWVTSFETQARYLLMIYTMSKAERENLQAMFQNARRTTNPLLNFYDFLDQVNPSWCQGRKFSNRDAVLKTFTNALRNMSAYQIVTMSRNAQSITRQNVETPVKIDLVMDLAVSYLPGGGGAVNPEASAIAPANSLIGQLQQQIQQLQQQGVSGQTPSMLSVQWGTVPSQGGIVPTQQGGHPQFQSGAPPPLGAVQGTSDTLPTGGQMPGALSSFSGEATPHPPTGGGHGTVPVFR